MLREMEATFEQMRRLAPSHPGISHFIGETYALVNLTEDAIAAYEKACGLPGVQAGTWMDLAGLYERTHRLDEARALIERAEGTGCASRC